MNSTFSAKLEGLDAPCWTRHFVSPTRPGSHASTQSMSRSNLWWSVPTVTKMDFTEVFLKERTDYSRIRIHVQLLIPLNTKSACEGATHSPRKSRGVHSIVYFDINSGNAKDPSDRKERKGDPRPCADDHVWAALS